MTMPRQGEGRRLATVPLPAEPAPNGEMAAFPPADRWDDWVEYDSSSWPHRVEKHYSLVPTVCFNCEASCGLLAYIDKETGEVRKFEGNPAHPGSRGRNCAKGPATLNQIKDPDRILYPLKRVRHRGSGQWERVEWDDVLADVAGRIVGNCVEGEHYNAVGDAHQHTEGGCSCGENSTISPPSPTAGPLGFWVRPGW